MDGWRRGLCGWADELLDGRCGWVDEPVVGWMDSRWGCVDELLMAWVDELVVGWMDGGWSCGRVAGLVSLASCQQGAEG